MKARTELKKRRSNGALRSGILARIVAPENNLGPTSEIVAHRFGAAPVDSYMVGDLRPLNLL